MSWALTGYACATLAGSYFTLAMLAETEPFINEEGEEEYTLSGYLLLSAAYIIKWPFEKLFALIKPREIVKKIEEAEPIETDNEFELII